VVANRVPPNELASFETAVLYQLLHALGLVLLGVVARVTDVTARLRWAARLMGIGVVVFSGSIYLATAGMPHAVLAAAPSGGMALMASWALLAWHAIARGHR